MNVLLWAVCWGGLGVLAAQQFDAQGDLQAIRSLRSGTEVSLAIFLLIGGGLNGMLALFNMLPLPPFDGASVVAGFSRTYYRWMHNPNIANVGFLIALVALLSGIGGVMGRWADRVGLDLALTVARLVA